MNSSIWYSYRSFTLSISAVLNKGSVWQLYFALFIVCIALFGKTKVFCKVATFAFPHAKMVKSV